MIGIQLFIEKFKSDKLAAILALLFMAAFGVSNNESILNGFPESWRGPIASICGIIKFATLGYGIYFSASAPTNQQLEKKLEELQGKPGQTVLASKELIVAAPALQEVADSVDVIKQVVEVVPQLQQAAVIAPVIADLVQKGEIKAK